MVFSLTSSGRASLASIHQLPFLGWEYVGKTQTILCLELPLAPCFYMSRPTFLFLPHVACFSPSSFSVVSHSQGGLSCFIRNKLISVPKKKANRNNDSKQLLKKKQEKNKCRTFLTPHNTVLQIMPSSYSR